MAGGCAPRAPEDSVRPHRETRWLQSGVVTRPLNFTVRSPTRQKARENRASLLVRSKAAIRPMWPAHHLGGLDR